MTKLNRTEKIGTFSILATVILLSGLILLQWLSNNFLYVPPSDSNNNTEGPEIPSDNHTTYFPPPGSNILGRVGDTDLKLNGEIIISGVGIFTFEPHQIVTKRPDIFQPGHFSVFDIIAYLNEIGKIAVQYHFDEEMNTNVIDSINGKQNWWYQVYYDGGWRESNFFRMDHYPVKDMMYILIFQKSPSEIDGIYASFRSQVTRRKQSEKMIIPEVIIRGRRETLTFKNVTVEALKQSQVVNKYLVNLVISPIFFHA